jgi:hypothetical protein
VVGDVVARNLRLLVGATVPGMVAGYVGGEVSYKSIERLGPKELDR